MKIQQYYLACLSHASYMITDDTTRTAAVVDPQRDIGQYLADAKAGGYTIKHVFLTHFHADFLAGHADPAASAAAAGGFLVTLATGRRLGQMIDALDGGAPFDEAFSEVVHATPSQAFEKWASRAAR
jgi:glyoxylase-like metal-dependent hydrolase (beta-lactamase superfamily II)